MSGYSRYLEFQYISPVSNIKFDSSKRYFLVIYNTTLNNVVILYKLQLKQIGNVDDTVRAYGIKQSVPINVESSPNYELKLFQINGKHAELLFYGSINLEGVEEFGKVNVTMFRAPTVLGKNRSSTIDGDVDFLSEQFFNFEKGKTKNVCIVFFTETRVPTLKILAPTYIKFDFSNGLFIFDRYNNGVIKELVPNYLKNTLTNNNNNNNTYSQHYTHVSNFIKTFCSNNVKNSNRFIEEYYVDTTPYINLDSNKPLFTKRMDLTYRPTKYEPYINSMIISPVDCRLRGFKINPTLQLNLNGSKLTVDNMVQYPKEIDGGSGFICRMCPQDYKYAYAPYGAYLKEVAILDDPYKIVLKFETKYFIPPDVYERAYASVIFGNHIYTGVGVGAGSRAYPEALKKQPDTTLIFYLVLIGTSSQNSISLTNTKLRYMKSIVDVGTRHKIKPIWFEQGEELANVACGSGNVIMLFNRPIDFAADIKHYSVMDKNGSSNSPLYKKMDVFVKTRDIIGILN